ncbi:alpha-1,2-fucosyltransferase [uncultured Pedobacter sp.]|uniref:alpha-1,2-fucosyltransferase n=1 Tax=uncultured Pedobacter sp. TaxID=246139 RepID=UPI0025E3C6A0|nr:alpha-1,2-fucosyltransferase [uncultured Pedobacter sp.]
MIVVKLLGGLGNQLFQYAIGKRLALINNVDLILDISAFEKYKLHSYGLMNFDIKAEIATSSLLKQINNPIKRLFNGCKLLKEKNYYYDGSILKKYNQSIVLIDGYWQSEPYFKDIRQSLLSDFKVIAPLQSRDREILQEIQGNVSISLHVRRGDFLSDKSANAVHGTCDLSYYTNAIEYFSQKHENPKFLVFSDDIQWCKENLDISANSVFCDHNNADTNYADLHLMGKCNHNIIANSSFSYWGAWLNPNPEKEVIAPRRWYADEIKNSQTKDLVPEKWIRI